MSTCTDQRPRDSGDRGIALTELVVRVASGDRDAFTALYDGTATRVFGLCRRLIVDHAGAEDLTQEVFLEVWTKASRFDPNRGSAVGWILQIAHHRAVDRIRTTESTRRRDAVHAGAHRGQYELHADHRVLAASDEREIRGAIGRLSPLRREALFYAYFTDHTHQEASDLLGVPLGTFKSRVRDAVLALGPLVTDVR